MRIPVARATDTSGDVDLTPMLDVVFIMLIFFVVTATFIREAGVPVSRADRDVSNAPRPEAIFVAIGANDEIRIEGRIVDRRALRANFARLHAERPGQRVVVLTAPASSAGALVAVLDAARSVDVGDVAVASD